MSDDPDKQWRIETAHHLKGQRLQFATYTQWSDTWDHDHCEACWAKFAEFDGPKIQHEGYATCDEYKHGAFYSWVCKKCFADLKDDMGWTLVSDANAAG